MAYMVKSGGGIFGSLGAIDPSNFTPDFNVRRGSQNERVRTVQFLLNVFGAGLETDAIFGPLTEAAVKAFQRANGLVQDGIVGPITSRALQDDESRNIGQSPPSKPPSGSAPRKQSIAKAVAIGLFLLAGGVGAAKIVRARKKRSNPRRRRR